MKNSIKLTALFLLASAGLFAAVPAKTVKADVPSVTISALASNKGIAVKAADAKSIVMIYDQDKNVLRKDVLAANGSKGYVLSGLENGDYTMEVTSNKQTVKKNIHVYNEDKTKTFIVQE
jgi:protein-disulfide isomerase